MFKALAILKGIITAVKMLPVDERDHYIDLIEKNNAENTLVIEICRFARVILNTPDDDIDNLMPV